MRSLELHHTSDAFERSPHYTVILLCPRKLYWRHHHIIGSAEHIANFLLNITKFGWVRKKFFIKKKLQKLGWKVTSKIQFGWRHKTVRLKLVRLCWIRPCQSTVAQKCFLSTMHHYILTAKSLVGQHAKHGAQLFAQQMRPPQRSRFLSRQRSKSTVLCC